jgi:hypothetical protein
MSPSDTARRRLSAAVALVAVLLGAAALGLAVASAGSLSVSPQRLTAFRSCVLTGSPSTTTAVADAWVDETVPLVQPAQGTVLNVRATSLARRRTFIRFDLTRCNPALSTSAAVNSAQVRLYVATAPVADATNAMHRVTGPCLEGLSTCWGPATITWSNQPTVASGATATATVCSTCVNQYLAWDVTADVAAFVAGSSPNYGWQVRDVAEGITLNLVQFRSTERNRAAEAPVLTIVYR